MNIATKFIWWFLGREDLGGGSVTPIPPAPPAPTFQGNLIWPTNNQITWPTDKQLRWPGII